MARVQVGYDPRAEALQTTAAPDVKTVQAQFDPRGNSAFRLAEALGKAEPVLRQFNEDQERKKITEQLLKKEAYIQRFRQDQQGGDITAVQIGQKFPEMVPAVRAQVTQAIGERDGETFVKPHLEEVLKDETLRYSSEARAGFLKGKRAEFISGLGGDDFYKAGAIKAYDAELDKWERSLQSETAKRDIEILSEKFDREVEGMFAQPDPKKALEELDARWKANNGLSNQTRNDRVIATATKFAFANDRPDVLDQIPDRFLNADTKAQIQRTKIQVQENRMRNYRDARSLESMMREDNLRRAKTEMVQTVANGGQVDPAAYAQDSDAFQFAMQMKDAGKLPEAQSTAVSQEIRTTILNASTMVGMDQKTVTNQILNNPSLNPKDKAALIAEVPKLLEGQIAMNDPMVKAALDTRLEARLKALEGSTNARIQTLLSGNNLRSQVMKSYDVGIRNAFQAYSEDNGGNWPRGRAKQEIIDRETDRAEKLLQDLTSVNALKEGAKPAPSAAPAPAQQSRPGVKRYNPATGKIE